MGQRGHSAATPGAARVLTVALTRAVGAATEAGAGVVETSGQWVVHLKAGVTFRASISEARVDPRRGTGTG